MHVCSVCMYMCACVGVSLGRCVCPNIVCVCLTVCVCLCLSTCARICMRLCSCMCVYTHVWVCACVCAAHVYACMCVYVCVYPSLMYFPELYRVYVTSSSTAGESTTISGTPFNSDNRWYTLRHFKIHLEEMVLSFRGYPRIGGLPEFKQNKLLLVPPLPHQLSLPSLTLPLLL